MVIRGQNCTNIQNTSNQSSVVALISKEVSQKKKANYPHFGHKTPCGLKHEKSRP